MAAVVLWFGLDDSVIDPINREATKMLMPSLKVKAHVRQTCRNGVSPNHLSVIVASNRP